MCGCATQKACKGAVNPPVGRCVIALRESGSCSSCFRQMRRARQEAKRDVGEVYRIPQVETSPGSFAVLQTGCCFQEHLRAAAPTILILPSEFVVCSVTFDYLKDKKKKGR